MHVTAGDRLFRFDGEPGLILAGEVHYFRLDRGGWARRLELLRDAGADTVATYVPWVVHEQQDGSIDLTGRVRPELDLGAFLDLAAFLGLRALVRPGPFTMGELRHEGIPPRIVREHPELRPLGWDGRPAESADLDVLAPAFLTEAARWYGALGPVLAPRTARLGGPIVAVQLDNEVGMLSWVTNTPVLSDAAVAELRATLGGRPPYPAADAPLDEWARLVRGADPAIAADLRVDLAHVARDRARRYIDTLAGLADDAGFGVGPLLVNVHGTEAGSARALPIGISQLAETWHGRPRIVAGSDHYLGSLSFAGAAELHLAHAFLAATQHDGQPLTSLEHEAGTGDYGGDLGHLTDPEAVVLKTRLLLALGVRAFNWYLFAGGTNRIDPREGDPDPRFGITGERHGSAAPVTPEGEPGIAYPSTAEAIGVAKEYAPWAATWLPETDAVVVGFVPDQYATEHVHPADTAGRELVAELAWARGTGPRGLLPRLLLAVGVRFGAVDLHRAAPRRGDLLVLGTGDVLDAPVQERVVAHVRAGGRLLLMGALPVRDGRGRPARMLADALGIDAGETVRADPRRHPAVLPIGWASGLAEEPVGRLTRLAGGEPVLVEAATGLPCGVEARAGDGVAVVVAAEGPGSRGFLTAALEHLGARPAITRDGDVPGLITATTRTATGERFLHAINVAGTPQHVRFFESGRPLLDGPLDLAPRSGAIVRILPAG